ncbi:hypothetical protein chiPu_0031823, partial [Chiloscyllium punctatum]|nr:hypothetical protein [Chiloscyllium punctatum]
RRGLERHRHLAALRPGRSRGARRHPVERRRDDEVAGPGDPAPARCIRRSRQPARPRQQMAGPGDQGRRQLRRDLRTQCRQGEPPEARARPQRHLEQGRLDVRDPVQVISTSPRLRGEFVIQAKLE